MGPVLTLCNFLLSSSLLWLPLLEVSALVAPERPELNLAGLLCTNTSVFRVLCQSTQELLAEHRKCSPGFVPLKHHV